MIFSIQSLLLQYVTIKVLKSLLRSQYKSDMISTTYVAYQFIYKFSCTKSSLHNTNKWNDNNSTFNYVTITVSWPLNLSHYNSDNKRWMYIKRCEMFDDPNTTARHGPGDGWGEATNLLCCCAAVACSPGM